MPELPEVEHLRRTLESRLVGRRIASVRLLRPDMVRNRARGRSLRGGLLAGHTIAGMRRLGKQLAIVSTRGSVLCVHLGMSGQLRFVEAGARLPDRSHVHCVWHLAPSGGGRRGGARGRGARVVFRDPRRFGGLWSFESENELVDERWSRLGPDALEIRAPALRSALTSSKRSIKAALLDQTVLAGVGNIYADEALFVARIHPSSIASALPDRAVAVLASSVRSVLCAAVEAGGSTFRDYVDADGRPGRATRHHLVYGRAGEPCRRCGRVLKAFPCCQRTTVACQGCQRRFGRRRAL